MRDKSEGLKRRTFYEFFAGGGMARAGLGASWRCLFANDFDAKKGATYSANWGAECLKVCDVAELTTADLSGRADLAWASFPCQDLSLAGNGAGLNGKRSGTFWPFWTLIRSLSSETRSPRIIALENVCGALTSHDGDDFAELGSALADAGYRFGAVIADAAHFLPQSRPRLFIIGFHNSEPLPQELFAPSPDPAWHPHALIHAQQKLCRVAKDAWVWWRLPKPPLRNVSFSDVIEENPNHVSWHSDQETRRLLGLMSPLNLAKVATAQKTGRRMIGAIYKRTRKNEEGIRTQRAEIRFDDIAGCLRTPAGGSSRQIIMIVEGASLRSRLLSPREAARLMGLPDGYGLPTNYNEAYHLAGDGVAVPVVRFLAAHLFEPLLASDEIKQKEAA